MNQDFLKLNKNLILGAIVSGLLAAITAYAFGDQEAYLLTTYTMIAEYAGFFGVFFPLFYLDNKKNYNLESGKKDKTAIKSALIKLGASFGLGEIFYLAIRWGFGYYLLTVGYDPNTSTLISEIVGFIGFLSITNIVTKFTKLYKH